MKDGRLISSKAGMRDRVGRCAYVNKVLRLSAMGAVMFSLSYPVDVARAETLFDALVSAYVGNPALNAQRSRQKATDEEVPRARSGFRPRITGQAQTSFENLNSNPASTGDGDLYPKSYSITVSQPIFRGFRTINSVREAEANVRAGRQQLKSIEQSTLVSAVTAYMDVLRDQSIVRLRRNNVRVLSEQAQASQDRFDVGEVTKTDVAQSEARLSRAKSGLSTALGELETSRAAYRRFIGHEAKTLSRPGRLSHMMPKNLQQAIDVGVEENPDVIAAAFLKKASRHAVDSVRGELLPEVNLEATYARNFDPSVFIDDTESTVVTGRVTVPLYQAGDVSARIRQSKHTYQQRKDELVDARDIVREAIVSAWSLVKSAQARLISDKAQADANLVALKGVKEEEQVGQRTILDVLDAEQELLDAKVLLETTRRDYVVASFSLLSAIGRLTAMDLGLAVEFYDPTEHYNNVRRKWIGTGPRLPRAKSGHDDWSANTTLK